MDAEHGNLRVRYAHQLTFRAYQQASINDAINYNHEERMAYTMQPVSSATHSATSGFPSLRSVPRCQNTWYMSIKPGNAALTGHDAPVNARS